MTNVCHNICERFRLKPKSLGEKKRCSVCCINFRTADLRCGCCGVKLRIKVRFKRNKKPRTSWPELERSREIAWKRSNETQRAKTGRNAERMASVLKEVLFMTIPELSRATDLSGGVIRVAFNRYPERFGTVMPPPGHKQVRRVWLKRV